IVTSGRHALRLDPWGAEYEGSIQIGDEDEPVPVDIRVEQPGWAAIRPSPEPPPRRIAFVDGVRRDEDRTVFGLLGSLGVGAAPVDDRARVAHEVIGRALVTGGGLKLDAFRAPVDGRGAL